MDVKSHVTINMRNRQLLCRHSFKEKNDPRV